MIKSTPASYDFYAQGQSNSLLEMAVACGFLVLRLRRTGRAGVVIARTDANTYCALDDAAIGLD